MLNNRSYYSMAIGKMICIITGIFLPAYLVAQPPAILWQQTVTTYTTGDINNAYNTLHDLVENPDGTVAAVGSMIADDKNYCFFKLAADGSLMVKKIIPHFYSAMNIVAAKDGGYVVAGSIRGEQVESNLQIGNILGRLMKLDDNGNVLWEKYYRAGTNESNGQLEIVRISSMIATSDGGYLIGATVGGLAGGNKSQDSKGATDCWLIKVNAIGAIEWEKTLATTGDEDNLKIVQADDGGYIAGVNTNAAAALDKKEGSRGMTDLWVVKLNKTGTIVWEKTIGGSHNDLVAFVRNTADKGVLVGSSSRSPVSGEKTGAYKGAVSPIPGKINDYWVIKLNAAGAVEWDKTLGGSDGETLVSGYQHADGGFIVAGTSVSPISGDKTIGVNGNRDLWILKLDAAGGIQWQMVNGGNNIEELSCVYPTKNGAFIVGGQSWSPASFDKTAPLLDKKDFWVVKYGPRQDSITLCNGTSYNFNGTPVNSAGTYKTTYTNIYGKDSVVELSVGFYKKETPLVTVQGKQLTSTGTYKGYQWLSGSAVIPNATAKSYMAPAPGLYRLTVLTDNDCRDTSAVYRPVFESNLFVPNVFTPNGDGKNDLLKVFGNELASAYLQIFNQWGQKIYESNDAHTRGWNGIAGGKPQPAGVYIYTLQVRMNDGTEERKKGSFSLVR